MVRLGRVVAWLGEQAEELGVEIFSGIAASEVNNAADIVCCIFLTCAMFVTSISHRCVLFSSCCFMKTEVFEASQQMTSAFIKMDHLKSRLSEGWSLKQNVPYSVRAVMDI